MRTHPTLRIVFTICLTVGVVSIAQGQATGTWVSGVGDDANPCSRTAPCKTFAGAISKTAEGGEIDALDPGGFGAVTITKAITLDGGGAGWASILAAGTNGIIVNIAASGINHSNDAVVVLRNISINGVSQSAAAGTNGINYFRAAQLHVERCQIQNFSTSGITTSLTSVGSLTVHDTVFNDVNTAVLSNASGAGLSIIQMDRCRVIGNSNGLNANGLTFATVRDSYFGGNLGANGAVRAASGCNVNVENSMFANNNIGVSVAGGTVRLASNDFFNNSTGISGTAESANNNRFRGNTTDGSTSNVITI